MNEANKPFENNTESEGKADSGAHHIHLHGPNHEELGEYHMSATTNNLPAGEDQVQTPDHSVVVDEQKGDASEHGYPGMIRKFR